MILGLRTVIYHVSDLQRAKAWYSTAFDVQPYFDEPFYVGFNIGGYELGLDLNSNGPAPGEHRRPPAEMIALSGRLATHPGR